nr:hypothetical protein [uncultured Kingella sp.]
MPNIKTQNNSQRQPENEFTSVCEVKTAGFNKVKTTSRKFSPST